MTTWQNYAANNGQAVTQWKYDGYRGFLTNKVYADGQGPKYTYTSGGRLGSRLWARGTNTTYTYNTAGDLYSIDYSDATPDVTYAYDRQGRRTGITNGTAITTLTLQDSGLLIKEYNSSGSLSGYGVKYVYDSLLRRVTNGVVNSSDFFVTFSTNGYDIASRLLLVSDRTNSATYSYLTNSSLLEQITFQENSTTRMVTRKSYDNLNRLTSISHSNSVLGKFSSFDYAYNSANQRTSVTNADGSRWIYQYDALGQVIFGKRYWSDGSPVAGQQFEYGFDDIGNRKFAASGGDEWGANLRYENYTVNNLNQYTQRTVPNSIDVLGSATNNSTVTVNDTASYRKGEYYRVSLSLDNSSAALYPTLTNMAVLQNGTNSDILTNINGNLFLARTPEPFAYDADGNTTNDGRWIFIWDAENRLVGLESFSSAPDASKKKLLFQYDAQSRRISKTVSNWVTSAWAWNYERKFLHDGWNLLSEMNGTTVIRSYMRGLDLSDTLANAGGVGGLLQVSTVDYGGLFLAHDGRGNSAAAFCTATNSQQATFEYEPSSRLLRITGRGASAIPIRFSGKYEDEETKLSYFGYRYLNVSRWLNRDPICESGGVNLYAFVQNNSIGSIDHTGLWSSSEPGVALVSTTYGEHGNYLVFRASCPRDWKVAGVFVTYDEEAMMNGLLTPWAGQARRDWLRSNLDGSFGGLRHVGRGSCSGGFVEVQAFMRARLVGAHMVFGAWRAFNGLPSGTDIVDLYRANTQIHWTCDSCCGRGRTTGAGN